MISLVNTIRKSKPLYSSFSKRSYPTFSQCSCKVKQLAYKPLLWLSSYATITFIPRLIATEITRYDVEENVTQLMTLARIAIDKGDFDRAEAILEMGISVSEEYQSYVALPYMYDILSSISFATGNLKKAELLLVRIIEKMVQIGTPEDDSQIIDFKLRLARIYSFNDKKKLAELGFRNCLAEQEEKILDGDTSTRTGILYVNVLLWYAMHRIKNKDYKRSKELIACANNYFMKIRGLTPYQEMVILYTLGDLNMNLEEYDMALQNLQSAVLLGKGIGSLNLPKYYLKLGKIYLKLGAIKTALQWLNEAHKLAELLKDSEVMEETENILLELE